MKIWNPICSSCGLVLVFLEACWPCLEPCCKGCNRMLQDARARAGIPPWENGLAL